MGNDVTGQGVGQWNKMNPAPTSKTEYAGENDYTLKSITIESPNGGEVDVSAIFTSMSIYEDLFSNTMSSTLSFVDTNNLVKNLPIIGQNEKLKVTFKLPWENSEIEELTYEFEIFRVSVRVISTVGKRQVVTLKAVSKAQFKNIHTKISKSYYNTIDGMVEEICKDYLDIKKKDSSNNKKSSGDKLEILEKTNSEKRKFIIPNWRPFDAINWLIERANAEGNAKACHYLFYQNRDGYKLTTIEKLLEDDMPKMEYLYMPRKYRETDTRFRDVGHEMRNIQNLIFEEPGDRLNENIEGMYGSKILTHDIVRKKYETESFSLKKNWDDTKHIESEYPICKNLDKYSDEEDTVLSFLPISKNLNLENDAGGETVEQNEKYKEWLLRRNSLIKQLSAHIIKVNVSGDSRRTCGDIVTVKLTPLEPGEDSPQPIDDYVSGKYLVTSINHIITQEGYEMNMELSKDSVSESYPTSNNFLGSQEESQISTIG